MDQHRSGCVGHLSARKRDRQSRVPKRSFARRSASLCVCAGQICNACRGRANATPSGVGDTVRAHADRLWTGLHPRPAHPEAQRDALTAAGCDQIFLDKASGKLARRSELDKALLSANRVGDQLVVTKLDRLGRSLDHLIELAKRLAAAGVDLVVLDQGIDTSTALGRMFFHILGAIAEFEHALMSERTMDGLAAARARGRTGGQKPKLGPRQVNLARQMYDELGQDGKHRYTVAQIAAEFGVTRPTIYRHLSKLPAPGGIT
nr:recombinase family protein [Mycobacterium nebraskense]